MDISLELSRSSIYPNVIFFLYFFFSISYLANGMPLSIEHAALVKPNQMPSQIMYSYSHLTRCCAHFKHNDYIREKSIFPSNELNKLLLGK